MYEGLAKCVGSNLAIAEDLHSIATQFAIAKKFNFSTFSPGTNKSEMNNKILHVSISKQERSIEFYGGSVMHSVNSPTINMRQVRLNYEIWAFFTRPKQDYIDDMDSTDSIDHF